MVSTAVVSLGVLLRTATIASDRKPKPIETQGLSRVETVTSVARTQSNEPKAKYTVYGQTPTAKATDTLPINWHNAYRPQG
jgi:hypothetical protein